MIVRPRTPSRTMSSLGTAEAFDGRSRSREKIRDMLSPHCGKEAVGLPSGQPPTGKTARSNPGNRAESRRSLHELESYWSIGSYSRLNERGGFAFGSLKGSKRDRLLGEAENAAVAMKTHRRLSARRTGNRNARC